MIALLLVFQLQAAEVKSVYQGVATKDERIIYLERHEVTMRDDEIALAKTTYTRPDGEIIATLTSDFSQSVTNAQHEFVDLRDGRRYGVRWDHGTAIMWDKRPKDSAERTVTIDKDFAQGKLVVGGQGLHYYMRTRIKELAKKELPIAILIPGKLDWYSFLVTSVGNEHGLNKFVIKAQSAFLRIFAPKLEVWYKDDGTLMKYRGLSNLHDDKGGNQQVEINYSY